MSLPNMIPCTTCGKENNILSRQQEVDFVCFNCGADLHLALKKYGYDYDHKKTIELKTKDNSGKKKIIQPQKNNNHELLTTSIQAKDNSLTFPASIGFLKVFAWLDLVISLLVAIYVWSNSDQFSTILGIGILLQGIIGFTLFIVVAVTAENVFFIKSKL